MNNLLANGRRLLAASSLMQNISLTLVRQLFTTVVQLMTIVLIARYLGPEGNGLYAMVILLPSMMTTFLNFGVGAASVFYIGRGEISSVQAIRENTYLGLIISILGIVVTFPILIYWGEAIFPGISIKLMMLGLIIFPVTLLQSFWLAILQGTEDFKAYNFVILVPSCLTLVFAALVLVFTSTGVFGVLIASLIGQLVGICIIWSFLKKIIINSAENESDKNHKGSYKRKLIGYGWKAHLSNIMAFVNYRIDIYLVNFLINPAATGIYVLAVQMAERLWMVSQSVSVVLFPRLSTMHKESDNRYRLTIKTGLVTGLLTFSAAIVLTIALYYLIEPVFGEAYKSSLEPYYWLLPGIVLGAVSRVYSNCIAAAGKPEWNFYVSILVVTVNILGNWYLIPVYGITGAAIATSIAYSINAFFKFYLIKRTV